MEKTLPLWNNLRSKPAFRVWRHRDFRLYETGMTLYSITGWMMRVGIGWLAWELTRSTAWLGVIAAADLGPMIVFAPFAGAVADRMDSLVLTRLAQFLLMLQAILLAVLIFADTMSIHALLAIALYGGVLYPFAGAGRQTLLPRTVPFEEFAPAIALDSALFQVARFIGPALAGIAIASAGVAAAFVAHAMGSVLFQTILANLRPPPQAQRSRGQRNLFRDIGAGFAYVRRHPGIGPVFLLMTTTSIFIRPVQDMLPAFAGRVFAGGPRELAVLTSSIGVGAMFSAGMIALRGGVSGLTLRIFLGFIGLALSTLALVASDNFALGVVSAGFLGFTLNTMSTSTQALTQSAVENNMRGRVMSLYLLIFRGMPAVGSIFAGYIAEIFGLRPTFAVGAAFCLAIWLYAMPKRHAIARAMEGEGGR